MGDMRHSKHHSETIAAGACAGALWLIALAFASLGTAAGWASALFLGALAFAGTVSVVLMVRDELRGGRRL